MMTIPDSRKDDILELYNRTVQTSLNYIDVHYNYQYIHLQTSTFPESPYSSDLTDVTFVNTSLV